MGYRREELIGKTVFHFDADLTTEWLDQNVWPRLVAGESVTFETIIAGRDETVFPVEIRWLNFREGGRPVTLILALNIAERKRADEERERRGCAMSRPSLPIYTG